MRGPAVAHRRAELAGGLLMLGGDDWPLAGLGFSEVGVGSRCGRGRGRNPGDPGQLSLGAGTFRLARFGLGE